MKVTLQLTLDGLLRAMRVKAHEMAEAVETQKQGWSEGERQPNKIGGSDGQRDA